MLGGELEVIQLEFENSGVSALGLRCVAERRPLRRRH